MTFKDIYLSFPELFDNGLNQISTEYKARIFEHLCLHRCSNLHLFTFERNTPYNSVKAAESIVNEVLALLEHKQKSLSLQLSMIEDLDLQFGDENQAYSTNSLNSEHEDGYDKLPNIATQSFSRRKKSGILQYNEAKEILELELQPVYDYLQNAMVPKRANMHNYYEYLTIYTPQLYIGYDADTPLFEVGDVSVDDHGNIIIIKIKQIEDATQLPNVWLTLYDSDGIEYVNDYFIKKNADFANVGAFCKHDVTYASLGDKIQFKFFKKISEEEALICLNGAYEQW